MNIFQVDAFTHQPFAGNPAGVCLLETEKPEAWMQGIAAEMNLSETAFLLKIKDYPGFQLRWFTPTTEVSLCGHATLASAHILWEESILNKGEQAIFHTRSGILRAEKQADWIEMVFPLRKVEPIPHDPVLSKALGANPRFTGRFVSDDKALYLMELESDQEVTELQPDFRMLAESDALAVMVTASSSKGDYDFVSRFFAPAVGIDEDPVTGSAHCYLAPYWADKLGKMELTGYQASKRGGIVHCKLAQNQVLLKGQAITIFRGKLSL
ncbi:MAG: PhzF family phenazine biosynthesis protein [Proteobacteria bacterium]|nr:PhzF family phenazine biosynthesis protein [Pseudomonadota bacterium]MBU4472100.1 PhzF family phenazine biosynthesis protein [Pseudomonadota bacterium]MCG2752901.1 PhzF family phenazine biosynthesis protein [Desulfobacteraceae bacterium]